MNTAPTWNREGQDRKEWEQNQKKRMLEEIAQEKKREHKETTLAKLLREMIKELE